jgi:hypothetical protein
MVRKCRNVFTGKGIFTSGDRLLEGTDYYHRS